MTDHIQAWHSQKSGTAVAPSSLDFDHYKCATHSEVLSAVDLLLRNVPVKIGFTPPSWCSVLDIEILKKYGVFDIDKMRLIQVMHAVFQINNKWLGKKVMEHVKSLKEMTSGQYACRKHHRANLCCLNKTLVFDYFQIRRSSGIYVTVDATGCFDRIRHAAIILTLQSFGLVATFARTLFEVLQRSMHSIQTGFGVSSPLYGNEHPPLQGTGQENGLAPTCLDC